MARKVLFITATRIGDAVLSTGLLDWLTRHFPEARFTIACGPLVAPLFERHPRLERLIELKKQRRLGHWRDLWLSVAGEKWDIAIDLRRSLMPWLVRSARRAVVPRAGPKEHRVQLVARTLKLDVPPAPRLWLTHADRARAVDLLGDTHPILAVGPAANWAAKVWPSDRFAELVRRLTGPGRVLEGSKIFISGGKDEESLIRPLVDALPPQQLSVHMGLDLRVTAAAFERSRMFIGNDSGLMHMAAAVGTPTLGLFGPTRDLRYAPWGPHCQVVRTIADVDDLVGAPDFDHRTTGSLMHSLSVDAVEAAAADLLAHTARSGCWHS